MVNNFLKQQATLSTNKVNVKIANLIPSYQIAGKRSDSIIDKVGLC